MYMPDLEFRNTVQLSKRCSWRERLWVRMSTPRVLKTDHITGTPASLCSTAHESWPLPDGDGWSAKDTVWSQSSLRMICVLFKASSALQLGGWCSDGSIMSALFPFQCPSGQGPLLVLAFNVDFTLNVLVKLENIYLWTGDSYPESHSKVPG